MIVTKAESENIASSMGNGIPIILKLGNLTTGAGEYGVIVCLEDVDTVSVTYQDGVANDTFSMVAGQSYPCIQIKIVTIDGGKVHVFK